MRPRWAYGFVCIIVLARTSEGLTGLRVLERTCSVGDLAGSSYSENPSLRWRWGRKASDSNLEINLMCLRLLISLSLSLSLSLYSLVFIYLACSYCSYLYMLDNTCAQLIYMLESPNCLILFTSFIKYRNVSLNF